MRRLLALLALLALPSLALAQGNAGGANARLWWWNGTAWVAVSAGNPLPTTSGGGGSGGTSSNFGATFPTAGTAIGVKNGANMVNLAADASSNLLVNLATALPAGANSIGAVTQGTTPWVVSANGGAFSVTQGTSPWVVSNGGTFAVQASQAGTWNIGTVTTLTSITNPVATNADTSAGTSASSKFFTVGGKTNDGTPQYQIVPLGTGGRTVIVEGFAGGTAVPVSLASAPTTSVTQGTSPWIVAGGGTAGSPGTAVLTIQGIASGTTVPTSCTAANCLVNITQFGSSNVVTGTGASGSGIPRVTISNDSSLAANQSVNLSQIGGTAVVGDPCEEVAHTRLAINLASASLTTVIAGTSAKHTYICSIAFNSATAQNVNFVAGTGTNCGTTVHVGYFGGTTAATGYNFAANEGISHGDGSYAIAGGTDTAADNICQADSGTGQVSGVLSYVQQ